MRSIIFSFKKSSRIRRIKKNFQISDLRYLFKRYGVQVAFVFLILLGLTVGSIYAKNADTQLLNSLDFLFTTNLDARLKESAIGIFSACFASDFLFLFTLFLLGLAPWGIPIMPLVVFFKGFGTGITAGYLFITYSLTGAGFYLLVILPGTFLFCMALMMFATGAFKLSKLMFLHTISKTPPKQPIRKSLTEFCYRSMTFLIMTFSAAILDAVLWMLFSSAFKF